MDPARWPVEAGVMNAALSGVLAVLAAACTDPKPGLLTPDASVARCLIPADYGALGTRTGTASMVGIGNHPALTIILEPGPPKDDFFIRLVAGNGAFASGALRTGTFPITGADASFTNCGLCTNIIADIVAGVGPTKFYYTIAGSVTLTATSPIAGSAKDLTFAEVDVGGTVVPGGCTTTVASIAFGT
jgi:hypothetical protein